MKTIIRGFELPPSSFEGLKPGKVERLPGIAIFTGPNGGGKSRLLRMITNQALSSTKRVHALLSENEQHENSIKQLENAIDSKPKITPTPWLNAIAVSKAAISANTAKLQELPRFDIDPERQPNLKLVYFAPKVGEFEEPGALTLDQTGPLLTSGGQIGYISNSFKKTLQTIQSLVSNYLISKVSDSGLSSEEVSTLNHQFNTLRVLVKSLLNMDISWTSGIVVSVGGTKLDQINSKFSQGQKWLLHFATSSYSEVALEDPLVLCLDEPELHLHPAALNQIIDILRRVISNGQMIIATHSVPLIAHLGYENTWYVQDGEVNFAGRRLETVIDGLIGNSEGVEKLFDMLAEPDHVAMARFALESLSAPHVAAGRQDDPQGKQILEGMREKSQGLSRPLRALDYGAGKGRLLDIASQKLGSDILKYLDYYAFDPLPTYADACRTMISTVYGDECSARYFRDKSRVIEQLTGLKFDVVVLCNVIHEIPPRDWCTEFEFIANVLDDDGSVFVVEDLQLPRGEHAHSEGFVIANREAFRRMFNVTPEEAKTMIEFKADDKKMSTRLMCISIPAPFIKRATPDSIRAALRYIIEDSAHKIQEIRQHGLATHSEGLFHAFYLHQFANSTFALKRLG